MSTLPSAPDGGVGAHPVGPALVATFDRLLAPSTVNTGTFLVRSGVVGVFGGVRYDPVRRTVTFVPDARAFRRTLQYEFAVSPMVRAWDGGRLAAPVTIRFVPGATEAVPPAPTVSLARDVAPLLAARCSTANCHGGPAPVMGLDLSSAAAIRRTTIRITARERPAPGPSTTTSADPAWGALARVDPGFTPGLGRPDYSYLIYKMLGDGPVVGARMPPDGTALTRDEIARVADWIAAGAPDN